MLMNRHVTFLCGRGGVYALGAIVANYRGDQSKRDLFLSLFLEVPIFLTSYTISHFSCIHQFQTKIYRFTVLISRDNN